MNNRFYNAFDLERFPPPENSGSEYRNPFQIERDRIIFSAPFRRLQSKTQVFQAGEYDFYRTRLTHSIEVAKIGRSICEYLRARSGHLAPDFFVDPDLTEGIGLAHDLGHPPFGHIGERKLNQLMAGQGGFEGNAQTLRILTETLYERPGRTKGIAPTRAFLDGVMKYKALHRECAAVAESARPNGSTREDENPAVPENHFIYDDQEEWRAKVFGPAVSADRDLRRAPGSLNECKSIECQIMDWADDTAYSLHDIVDGVHARYIDAGSLEEWQCGQSLGKEEQALLERLRDVIRDDRYESYFGWRVGEFVQACRLLPREGVLADQTHRHGFHLQIDPAFQLECRLYKSLARDLIFRSPHLQQLEFKGGRILEKLFDALVRHCGSHTGNGLRLLPPSVRDLIAGETTENARVRRLCDHVASLTDGQALRTYKRLFDPDYGSIAELI